MLTKKEFYSKCKNKFANKHEELCCVYNFECEGVQCELWYRLTSVYDPQSKKSEWYMSLQLINKRAEKISDKYIRKDLYEKLANLKIYSDFQAWKFVEKWITEGVSNYVLKRIDVFTNEDFKREVYKILGIDISGE